MTSTKLKAPAVAITERPGYGDAVQDVTINDRPVGTLNLNGDGSYSLRYMVGDAPLREATFANMPEATVRIARNAGAILLGKYGKASTDAVTHPPAPDSAPPLSLTLDTIDAMAAATPAVPAIKTRQKSTRTPKAPAATTDTTTTPDAPAAPAEASGDPAAPALAIVKGSPIRITEGEGAGRTGTARRFNLSQNKYRLWLCRFDDGQPDKLVAEKRLEATGPAVELGRAPRSTTPRTPKRSGATYFRHLVARYIDYRIPEALDGLVDADDTPAELKKAATRLTAALTHYRATALAVDQAATPQPAAAA